MKKSITIYPAILSHSKVELEQKVRTAREYNFRGVQIDVMDGKFVKDKTYSDKEVLRRMKSKGLFFEIQLMVKDPASEIIRLAKAGDRFIIHLESCRNPRPLVHLIRGLKKGVGIAVNPETPVSRIFPYIKDIDVALVMTVRPGKSGQKLIPQTLLKVRRLRKRFPKLPIEVDGGINGKTATLAINSGASILVVGSYFWKANNKENSIHNLVTYEYKKT